MACRDWMGVLDSRNVIDCLIWKVSILEFLDNGRKLHLLYKKLCPTLQAVPDGGLVGLMPVDL